MVYKMILMKTKLIKVWIFNSNLYDEFKSNIMNNLWIKKISAFIKEVRDSNDIDKEKQIVEKKLNKIRTKFMKSSTNTDNKKYIW